MDKIVAFTITFLAVVITLLIVKNNQQEQYFVPRYWNNIEIVEPPQKDIPPPKPSKPKIKLPCDAIIYPGAVIYKYNHETGVVHKIGYRTKNVYFHCTVLSRITSQGKMYYLVKNNEPGFTADHWVLKESSLAIPASSVSFPNKGV